MNETSARSSGKIRTGLHRAYALVLAVFMLLAFTAGGAYAAMPPANADIGNKATATYNDGAIVGKTAESNTVHTFVQQVWAFTLASDQNKTISAGGTVYFRHTIANTGNGGDTFTLDNATIARLGDAGNTLNTGSWYSDNAGVVGPALGSAPNPTILAGGSFSFWYAVTAAAGTPNTAQLTVTLKANDAHVAQQTNTDIVTVNPFANLTIDKSIASITGPIGGVYTIKYNIHYVNNGNAAAANLTFTDIVPGSTATPATSFDTIYVAGSGLWSGGGALTDAAGGDPAGINYSYTAATRTVSAVITTVPANGGAGDLNFSVTYPATTTPATWIYNTAGYAYDDGGLPVPGHITGTAPFNYQIPTVRSVVIDDIGSTTDSPAVANDNVIIPSAPQGSVVWFDNVLHNTGNIADNYKLTTPANSFTGGISYWDGLNGTTIAGTTASVPAGGSIHVWVRVIMPMNGAGSTGGPFALTLKAESAVDSTKSDTVVDTLTAITPAAVDITNDQSLLSNPAAPGVGVFANGEAAPVQTKAATNAAPAVYSLYLNNTGATDDSFQLSYSTATPFNPATVLPVGWTLTFNSPTAGTCAAPGAAIPGSTIAVTAGLANAQLVCAVVTPPAGASPAIYQLYFKAYGSNTQVSDVKHDEVSVATGYTITITPNNVDTISPSGSKIYTHTVTNNSNVAVATATGSYAFTLPTNSMGGWSALLCKDVNCATQIPVTLPAGTYYDLNQIAPAGLAANGGTVTFYVKVMAPATALNDVNTTTINLWALTGLGSPKIVASATDTTTMREAQLTMQKSQALDSCGATTPAARALLTYNSADINNAGAGKCIHYKIVVHNGGNQQATALQVKDSVPPFVWYWKGSECSPLAAAGALTPTGDIDGTSIAGGSISEPANCASAGAGIEVIFGTGGGLTLPSNSTATLYFSVEVQK